MQVADSLYIPDELERARAAGELVVFAGAGVSMGPPANLPNFVQLARDIAEPRVPWKAAYKRALDVYLGRAEREDVDVQARARRILDIGGAHTPLHEHLLGLFGEAERVRVITTNFDQHFSSAAAQVYRGQLIPEFVGPALPPGQDFRGVVQLHGSLGRSESRLVLTDADFAAAYMAEGWAARFLSRVFADRTVLFVGYSLSDPIMRYLLHALPPTGRWYAVWHRSEAGQGAEHRIHPVTFKKPRAQNRYRDLNDGMKRWRWYATATAVDHDREIRRLVDLGPPSSPLDADYLRARLNTDEGCRVFWDVARGECWFNWVAAERLLEGLVDPRGRDPRAAAWGRWCLDHFCDGEAPAWLRYLRGRPLTLDPGFRAEVGRFLCFRKPLPPGPVLRQLLALLVGGASREMGAADEWEWLLKRLISEGLYDEALALLRAATHLELHPLEHAFAIVEESAPETLQALASRVSTRLQPSRLGRVLDDRGAALAEARPHELLALTEQRIEEAYQLLDLARGGDDGIDWFSFGRTAVAPSNQDRTVHTEDVFVEMVRMVLDRFASVAPDSLREFVARHEANPRTLLRRLGVYALSIHPTVPSEDALTRATTLGWARDPWVRPEFYRLLSSHFVRASEEARSAFVAALQDDGWWGGSLGEREQHMRFSISVKLLREAPDSPSARTFASVETEAHPDWREQDRDGFLSRFEVGWGRDEPSPIEAEALAAWSPDRVLAEVRTSLAETGGRADALFGALQHAAQANPSWAAGLLANAVEGDDLAARIAASTLYGLREADVSHDDRMAVLSHAAAGRWNLSLARPLATLLDRWGDTLGNAALPALLDAMDAAADTLYERSAQLPAAVEVDGWTERAINHPAGQAAQIWWQVANARDWVHGQRVVTLDAAEKARWGRVLADPTPAGAFARPILGMATDRFAMGDFPWAVQAIFPAFDPAAGPERAAQLWDGRLMQGQWFWGTVEGLRPTLSPMFRRAADLLPARAKELGDVVSLFAADPERSGFTRALLQTFVQYSSEEARVAFADAMPGKLARLESIAREHVWRDLLLRYFADRRTRMPIVLSAAELRSMAQWARALPEVADEVVSELRASPKLHMKHADAIIAELNEDEGWVRTHPAAAAGLVAFFAERQSIPTWSVDDAVSTLETALGAGAPPAVVRKAGSYLVAFPSARAAALIKRLPPQE